ncbi:MAG: FAD-binding oxidoreductase [Patescibacteria group bacterium]
MRLAEEVKKFFKGEIYDDTTTLDIYSRDASLFKVKPKLVVYPKDREDIKNLVRFVNRNKLSYPELSITMRAAGSDMSGGPLNESIIVDVTKHINKIGRISKNGSVVEPGAFYRDFEKKTLARDLILPCYTASKNLCAMGGMVANNSGGQMSLRYGKMEDFVKSAKYIFSDGREYEVKPLSKTELEAKITQGDFEGNLYKKIYNLLEDNKQLIQSAKPQVSKNSAGYYLWNVWDGKVFDLNKLLTGAQGTLGVMTEASISLVSVEKSSRLLVIFLSDLDKLAEIVNSILRAEPDSIESYDDATMKLAWKFFPEILRAMKPKHFFSLLLSFIPEFLMMLSGGVPKLILLVECSGKTDKEAIDKMDKLELAIHPFKVISRKTISREESEKYWTIRRESFNLLRKHLHGMRTAPFVDDVVVSPEDMPEFLPKMRAILDEYKLNYTIAGHAGNGNFHIIPLMDLKKHNNVRVIKEVGERVYNLVGEYHGSITGEHNDGIVRTPYLRKMYKPEVLELFKRVKQIFDPQNIFNPGKKVPSTSSGQAGGFQYLEDHIDF